MKKQKPIKIRRTWTRSPVEQVRPDKDKPSSNPCDNCRLWETDPNACCKCDMEDDLSDFEWECSY